MGSAPRTILYLSGFILLAVGLVDIVQQLKAGDDLHWQMPLLFLGFGAGIPAVLFASPNLFDHESDSGEGSSMEEDHGYFGGDGDGGD